MHVDLICIMQIATGKGRQRQKEVANSCDKMATYIVESLVQQCQHYIAMHLEEFPVNHLSLLPLSTRRELLYQLPIADICLRLENTEFTAGLDMTAFWKSTWEDSDAGMAPYGDNDMESYKERWDSTDYVRAMVYGLVATCAMGHLRTGEYWFNSPLYRNRPDGIPESGMMAFPLLYAVRKPSDVDAHCGCELKFPLRYSHKSDKEDKHLTVYEVVNNFSHERSEFPKIFPEIEIMNDICLDNVFFLRDAVYVGIKGYPLAEGFEFLKAAIKEATNLEVLLLDHWGEDDEWEVKFFDELCSYLSSCRSFLSNFRLFKMLPSTFSKGFVVSRKNFNKLIAAYFAAPTDHVQKMEFHMIKIQCYDVTFESFPEVDHRYLPFKIVKFDKTCKFVSEYKPTPQTISHWLGQSISVLDNDSIFNDTGSCSFEVQDNTSGQSRKRKHSEIDQQ